MARLTKGPGDKVIAGQKRVANAAKVAANKAKVEANRKKVQANAAKYKTSTSTTSTKKSPSLANQKVATKTAGAAAKKMEYEFKGGRISSIRGMKQGGLQKLPSMDSTTFMNLAKSSDPYSKSVTTPKGNVYGPVTTKLKSGQKNLYEDLKTAMSKEAKKYPGAKFSDFKLDPKTGSFMYKYYTPKKK